MIPANGDRVEVRQKGRPLYWGTFLVIPDFMGKGRHAYYVKPNGRNPEIGLCVRRVEAQECRKLSILELLAEAADETAVEVPNGPAG